MNELKLQITQFFIPHLIDSKKMCDGSKVKREMKISGRASKNINAEQYEILRRIESVHPSFSCF